MKNFRYYDLILGAYVCVLLCANLIGPSKVTTVHVPILGSATFVAGVSNAYQGYFLAAEHFRTSSYISCGSLYGERGGEIVRDAALGALREVAERRAPRPVRPAR